MSRFAPHTLDAAPEGGRDLLTQISDKYGFLPNLVATMAESPELATAYAALGDLLFGRREAGLQEVPADTVDSIRNDEPMADARLEALRRFTTTVVEQRDRVSEDLVGKFLAEGFDKRRVCDVMLGAAMKMLSKYRNHRVDTPLDAAFSGQGWTAAGSKAA